MPNDIVKYDGPSSPPQSSFVQTLRQRVYQAYEGFFGPLLPLDQQAPQGTPQRVFDFSAGTNLSYIPRSDEPISFAQLRALADGYDLLRIIIETRKDQISKVKWRFGLKAKPGESRQLSRKKSENDPRVQKVSQFFDYPDGRHDWRRWISAIIEEMLTTDAVSILVRRNRAGEVIGLRQIDGKTIHPVINNEGIAPPPPEVAYQQIIKGMVGSNLTTDDLLYAPRNVRVHKKYGFPPVEQIITIINLGIRREIHQINYYTEGNIPEAICQVPDTWTSDQVKQFQSWFDSTLTGNLAKRRRLTFVPGLGGKDAVQFTKDTSLKDEMDEYLARVICFAFSLPPTAFVKQVNRATAQTVQQTALQEGLEPLKAYVVSFVNQIIQSPQYMNLPDLEIVAEDDEETDKLKQAQIDEIYVRSGVRSIDEIRTRDGLDTIGVGCGIITAQGFVPFEDGTALLPSAAAPPEPPATEKGEKDLKASDVEASPAAKADARNREESLAAIVACDLKSMEKQLQKIVQEAGDAIKAAKSLKVKKKVTVSTATLPSAAAKRATGLSLNIARFLKKQGKKIAAQATEAYSHVTKDDSSDEVERILADIDLDWAALVTSFETSIGDTASESAKDTLLQVGVSGDEVFNLVNQDALDFATERAADLVGKKIVNGELIDNPNAEYAITQTTREELRQIISKAFSEGMTPAELEKAIEESFQFSDTRSEMIARTEMAKAHVAGSLVAAKRSGVVTGKRILLGSEHTGPDECDVAVAQDVIALDEDFNTGDDGPPLHPNCVCGLELIYEGEA